MLLYQFGLPVGSTVLVAASEPGGSSGFGLSERREGVCSEAPGMFPVWTESSIQVEKQSVLIKKKNSFAMHQVNHNSKIYRFTYRADLGQQRLLGLTEECFALDCCDGFWVQLTHGLPCQPLKTNDSIAFTPII